MCERLLLRIPEVGALLGIKRSKVYQLLQSGRLKSVRLDGSRRVLVTEVGEFVARLSQEAAEEDYV